MFPRSAVLAVAGGVALASCAWTGHAAGGEGLPGSLQRLSDIIHLLAAATWLGALACFLRACLARGRDSERIRALVRFAGTGTVIRSEEQTSELQSLMRISYAVFCLKKKTKRTKTNYTT